MFDVIEITSHDATYEVVNDGVALETLFSSEPEFTDLDDDKRAMLLNAIRHSETGYLFGFDWAVSVSADNPGKYYSVVD